MLPPVSAMVGRALDRPGFAAREEIARRTAVRAIGLGVALAALLVVAALSLAVGSKAIGWAEVVRAFTAFDPDRESHLIVRDQRLPRTVVGLLVGSSLAAAGALMQALTRNPLADPGILGVNAGAATFVVLGVSLLGVRTVSAYVWLALLGAMVVSVAVHVVGSLGRSGGSPVRLTLAGAAISIVLGSVIGLVMTADQGSSMLLRNWALGSLVGADTSALPVLAPLFTVGLVMAVALGPALNALALGDEVASGIGQRVAVVRGLTGLAVVLLAGTATAIAGPVGFVGLMVPYVGRVVAGPDQRWIIPYSIVVGPVLLLGADVVGRVVQRPEELDVGVITGVIGVPLFIYLARRSRLVEL